MRDSRKKRICFLHHTGAKGGGTKSFLDVILMLKNDFEVIACIPSHANELERSLSAHGIWVEKIKTPFPLLPRYSGGPGIFTGTFFSELLKWRKIKEFCLEIESFSPDFIMFNSIVSIISAPFFKKESKKICFIRETLIHPFSLAFFSKILRKHFSLSCFLAEAEKNKFGLDSKKTIVLPDTVPENDIVILKKEEARRKEGIEKEDFCLLFMGGSAPLKGGRILLQAMARLTKEYHLLLCGNFSIEKLGHSCFLSPIRCFHHYRLRKVYQMALKSCKVSLIGYRENISSLMNATDVVVFPSMEAHQPRPCIEAGYYGKPVILTDFKETEEYFKDGFNALTFKKGSEKDLLSKILYLKHHEEERTKLGKNNEKESREKHNYDLIYHKLKAALTKELLEERVEDCK